MSIKTLDSMRYFHRRKRQRNMKTGALDFLILTGLFKAALCTHAERNIYVPIKKTWSEARNYCRVHYTDLSSIANEEEDEDLLWIVGEREMSNAWIGLYKDANDMWKWAEGKDASYLNWSKQHIPSKENRCVVQNKNGWQGMDCNTEHFPFYCFQSSLVLVKENKTWEEAIEQCRNQDTDLVSLPSESALAQILETSREAQTDHVWIGLRYLADKWMWVDGEMVEYQAWSQEEAPQCPDWSRHCGALSLEGQHWDGWDCADKLNYVCK